MGLMADGLQFLTDELNDAASVPVKYRRGTDIVTLSAVPGGTNLEEQNSDGSVFSFRTRDYTFRTEDMVLNGLPLIPGLGDFIQETSGITGDDYWQQVSRGVGGEFWDYLNGRRAMKVFTSLKETGFELIKDPQFKNIVSELAAFTSLWVLNYDTNNYLLDLTNDSIDVVSLQSLGSTFIFSQNSGSYEVGLHHKLKVTVDQTDFNSAIYAVTSATGLVVTGNLIAGENEINFMTNNQAMEIGFILTGDTGQRIIISKVSVKRDLFNPTP